MDDRLKRVLSGNVRLKDENGNQLDIISGEEAFRKAKDCGLDLIIINDRVSPAICKIGDLKKELYLKKKAAKEQDKKNRENARRTEEKTITFGPNIGDNDFNVKMSKIPDWFEEGHSVKIVVQFRGRELSHKDMSLPRLKSMIDSKMAEFGGIVRNSPCDEGRDWSIQYCRGNVKKDVKNEN